MITLPHSLYTAEKTRELDRITIQELGVSGTILMERAGSVAYEILLEQWPQAQKICVMCGTGNNGGDGFVIARLAVEQQKQVAVFIVGDKNKITGDALAAMQRLHGAGLEPTDYDGGKLPEADVVVDAMFGTGLVNSVEGIQRQAIIAINQHPAAKLAIDVPSGLHADTGQSLRAVVKADCTVSFIGLNQGLFTADGPDVCGKILFNNLRIPEAAYEKVSPSAQRIDYAALQHLLKPRHKNSHKGVYGHVLVIGGDVGMSGAARMAAEAALRCGAGLVSVATRQAHASVLNSGRPEIMAHPVEDEIGLQPLLERATVVVVGPGLGKSEWAQTMFALAFNSDKPMVVDADALNLLARENLRRDNWILTPHPGEAARMLDVSIQKIQHNRFVAAEQLVERFDGTVVLKGNGTIIQTSLGNGIEIPQLCDQGNPGMASGGMGDILSGILAALLAQGMSLRDAAALGVALHAAAGDAAAKGAGERGLLASDLLPSVRRLVNPV